MMYNTEFTEQLLGDSPFLMSSFLNNRCCKTVILNSCCDFWLRKVKDIQNNVRKIVTENPKMIEFTGKSGTSSGDAFLIATAMKYGLIIITEENKDKQMKIPQISKKYGITSVNITSLCEMEQWKF